MKHTAGNWKHSQEVKSYYNSVTGVPQKEVSNWIRDDKENAIAVTMDHRRTEEENAANARLMAGAPEILEALEDLYDQFGDDHAIWHRVANLISKVKGE